MENPSSIILEITSDKEASSGDGRKEGYDDDSYVEDCGWLLKLLAEVEADADDSQEILVLAEAIPNPEESNVLPFDYHLSILTTMIV